MSAAALAEMPLTERAHYWLHGRLPDGRRVFRDWHGPHEDLREYVARLEAVVASARHLVEITKGRTKPWRELQDALAALGPESDD